MDAAGPTDFCLPCRSRKSTAALHCRVEAEAPRVAGHLAVRGIAERARAGAVGHRLQLVARDVVAQGFAQRRGWRRGGVDEVLDQADVAGIAVDVAIGISEVLHRGDAVGCRQIGQPVVEIVGQGRGEAVAIVERVDRPEG